MSANKSYKREQVVNIINSVLGKITAPQDIHKETLVQELLDLKHVIDGLRHQLNAANAGEISNKHIPSATDELDAVVGTTEEATQTIMEACEQILGIMKGSEELFPSVESQVVKIFEACTFQDITGQRIKKVITSLKEIEAKTSSVLKAINGELVELDPSSHAKHEETSLLNGPALPKDAVTQDDIDAMLAEFDKNNK